MVLLTPFWASGEPGVSWAPGSRPAGQWGPGVPSPGRPDSPAHSMSPITCPGQGQTHTQDTQRLLPSVCRCSVSQSCPTLCDAVDCSSPGLLVHHQLPEFTPTHVRRVGDAIQPSHPLSSPSPPVFNLSQHQGLFQRVSPLHQVGKLLELRLQHQSFP